MQTLWIEAGGRGCDKSYLRLDIYQSAVGQNILELTSYLPGWTSCFVGSQPYEELVDMIRKYVK